MYYSISGTLVHKDDSTAVIETGGVAYEILVPRTVSQNLPATGGTATIFTKMIVREDDTFLVGFSSIEDRRLFESLLSVSGIGPKQSLKILSEMPSNEIRGAIINGNDAALSKIKGIGAKTASRIILELKDKMQKLDAGSYGQDLTVPADSVEKKKIEILLAMRVLGYSDPDSRRTIDQFFTANPGMKDRSVEEIIKAILSRMNR